MALPPIGVTSNAAAAADAYSGGDAGFYFAPAYSKPLIDLSNPWILGAAALLAFLVYRKLKK